MINKFYTLLFLIFTFSTGYAQIYSYVSDTSGLYGSVATNATGIKLTRYNGAVRPASPCATGFSSSNFSTSTTYATSMAAVEADVTAAGGYMLSVTGFSIDLRRSGTGPANVRLAYSTDGGTTWIDKGTDDAPNNGGCGSTVTATWTSAFTVASTSTLKFRIYGFNASGTTGTLQILNLNINGSVLTTDSIFTTASSFGPFCEGMADTISVPFTQSGTFSGLFNVQLSDASGIFPNNATIGIISTGSATSPVRAVIPSGTAWANGYRVRVVNTSPTYYSSGDNGSNILIDQAVTPSFSISASNSTLCAGQSVTFSTNSVTNGGSTPTYQWYVNGGSVSTGSSYTSSTLANNDSVYALMTSNAACAVPTTVAGNKTGMTVYPTAASEIYDTLCPGGSLSYGGQTRSSSGAYPDTLNTIHGCDSIVTLHLKVKTLMATSLSASICQGGSYTFNGVSVSTAGPHSDTLRCDSIVTLTLTVNAAPVISWSPTDTVFCNNTGNSSNVLSASPAGGVFTGLQVSNDTLYHHGIAGSIWIVYTYTDGNHCTNSDSAKFRGVVCGGISENSLNNTMSLYPNPSENIIHIDAGYLVGTSTITVTDMSGKLIMSQTATGTAIHTTIDLSGLEKGMYLITLRDAANNSDSKRVIKD